VSPRRLRVSLGNPDRPLLRDGIPPGDCATTVARFLEVGVRHITFVPSALRGAPRRGRGAARTRGGPATRERQELIARGIRAGWLSSFPSDRA
jgi:hypothetical protein